MDTYLKKLIDAMPEHTQHPLRDSLTKEDLVRIQGAIDGEHDDVTTDELEAAEDIFFDAVASRMQTHESILILQ